MSVEPTYINAGASHPATLMSDDDRAWFEDNPSRVIRLRRPTDGDGDPTIKKTWKPNEAVIVFCPKDGFRFRIVLTLVPGSPTAELLNEFSRPDDAELAPLLWHALDDSRWPHGPRLQQALEQCILNGGRLANWSFFDGDDD